MMVEHRSVPTNEDPVCGMTVNAEQARSKALVVTFDHHEYIFCGKGCLLEFRDDPTTFLALGYRPSM